MNVFINFSIIMLLLALLPLPYGYYYILKTIVCVTSIREILVERKTQDKLTDKALIFIVLAVLYNPLVAIPLGKLIWSAVNGLTIAYFIYYQTTRRGNK